MCILLIWEMEAAKYDDCEKTKCSVYVFVKITKNIICVWGGWVGVNLHSSFCIGSCSNVMTMTILWFQQNKRVQFYSQKYRYNINTHKPITNT